MEEKEEPQRTRSSKPEPQRLPVVPLFDLIVFPRMMAPLQVSRKTSLMAVEAAVKHKPQRIILVTQTDSEKHDVSPADLMPMGVIATIGPMVRMPDGGVHLLAQGEQRVRLLNYTQTEPYLEAEFTPIQEETPATMELSALMDSLKEMIVKYVQLRGNVPADPLAPGAIKDVDEPGYLADLVAVVPELESTERKELFITLDVAERLRLASQYLSKQVEMLDLKTRISSEVQKNIDKTQREYLLREQMKEIQRELGELDAEAAEAEEWREKIKAAEMPDNAREKAEKEVARLEKMPQASPEVGMIRTYLDWLVGMPWSVSTDDQLDIKAAAEQLDRDHYGLDKVKERILEHLAVRQLSKELRSPIICLVGPPGVGKTSLGRSISTALGRKFARMSLGGVHDEAEIRGHRRTYIGSLPGRIVQAIRQAGSNNPVIMLDEIDKVGSDFRGDPSAALLEVLDPEQNVDFADHYLEVPFDLSRVLFITTANVLHTIPPALRDRMEIIELPGYTEEEKLHIGLDFLVPKQRKFHGIEEDQLTVTEDAMRLMVREYTREAGVRQLEREIATICRKLARSFVENGAEQIVVDKDNISTYLKAPRFDWGMAEERDEVGVATGLSVSEYGGDIMSVEVTLMDGKANFILSGQLGDVMQESARAAMSYVHSRARELGINPTAFENHAIHVHVPAGAIPKEGPSAGIALATALVSAFTGRPVRRDVAMTGEVTLRGNVLPIGGLKDKTLAAHRAGIRTVLLPKKNLKDVEEIPEDVRNELTLIPVEHMDEVLEKALLERPSPSDLIKYAHFDAVLMPGLEGTWPTPPATSASG
ncbi:MAG TPA: endopeptidase La [Chloroflexota bacterium]|nr:endopeptidase La [Chloroflexota bacterium]